MEKHSMVVRQHAARRPHGRAGSNLGELTV